MKKELKTEIMKIYYQKVKLLCTVVRYCVV